LLKVQIDTRNEYNILMRKMEEGDGVECQWIYDRLILNLILKKKNGGVCSGYICFRTGTRARSF
jgi:hypothetical protein